MLLTLAPWARNPRISCLLDGALPLSYTPAHAIVSIPKKGRFQLVLVGPGRVWMQMT